MDEWVEPDGTIYRKNAEGNYDVIPPEKKSKAKKSVKKSASSKKAN